MKILSFFRLKTSSYVLLESYQNANLILQLSLSIPEFSGIFFLLLSIFFTEATASVVSMEATPLTSIILISDFHYQLKVQILEIFGCYFFYFLFFYMQMLVLSLLRTNKM